MKERTKWNELTTRRQEILETVEEEIPDDTFACSELNSHLTDPTTTTTLNKLAGNDNYLRRWPGGSSMLLAIIPDGDNEPAFRLSGQEELAQKMVNREGLSLDPTDTNWRSNAERQQFQDKFNSRASAVKLRATWTRNKYRLNKDARYEVRANGKEE